MNPWEDENVDTYVTTKELKKTAFTVKNHNIEEAINMQVTLIHFLVSFSILENHIIKYLYEALYKIFMISMKYNTIISYYAKSAMREKNR